MSNVPLVCESCKNQWNYKGSALNNPNKRVQCSKCNSTKILDTLGNKVNAGFTRRKDVGSVNVGHVPPNQAQPSQTNPPNTTQQSSNPTLDLSSAKEMLGKPIPSVQHVKNQQAPNPH